MKEQIRASHGFTLTETTVLGGLRLFLISVADQIRGEENLSSAVAATLNIRAVAPPHFDHFLDTSVCVVGRLEVNPIAQALVAHVDTVTSSPREAD